MDFALLELSDREVKRFTRVLLASYAVMSVLFGGMIVYLRRNRQGVLNGESKATCNLLLPSLERLLWLLAAICGGFTALLLGSQLADFHVAHMCSVHSESVNAGRSFIVVFIAVFVLEKSVSVRAIVRTSARAFVLSCYSIPIVYASTSLLASEMRFKLSYWATAIAHGSLVILFALIAVRPPGRANKHVLRAYCAFGVVYLALDGAYLTALYQSRPRLGFALAYVHIALGSLSPLVVWRVLVADTAHWRAMGQRACALQSLFGRDHVREYVSPWGIPVLVELHRRFVIDFSHLELLEMIGTGSMAIVYRAVLRSQDQVAVKVYTPACVSEDTVAVFSHEAALCSALSHPNVVRLLGMCVSPPTICLVSELCVGSLDIVTRAAVAAALETHVGVRHQQLLLHIGYMIDAARAVAHLHSFSPALTHHNIKPSSFLVDNKGSVKLTHFGDARCLPKASIAWEAKTNVCELSPCMDSDPTSAKPHKEEAPTVDATILAITDDKDADMHEIRSSLSYHIHGSLPGSETPTLASIAKSRGENCQVSAATDTTKYMAPEVMKRDARTPNGEEAADVFALAITMWDVLYPGVDKFQDPTSNYLHIIDSVTSGARPMLDDPRLHPRLRALLESSWHEDPDCRPSAHMVVCILEQVQEEVSLAFALELRDEMERVVAMSSSESMLVKLFPGELAVQAMQEMGATVSTSESVRLGNMLMDSGFLHHMKHAHSFDAGQDMFFFDVKLLNQRAPDIAILEQLGSASDLLFSPAPDPNVRGVTKTAALLTESQSHSNEPFTHRESLPEGFSLLLPYQQHAYNQRAPFIQRQGSHNSNTTDGCSSCDSDGASTTDLAEFADALSNWSLSTTSISSRSGDRCSCRQLGQLHKRRKGRRHGHRKHRRHRLGHRYKPIPEESATAITTVASHSAALRGETSASHSSEDLHFDGSRRTLSDCEPYSSPVRPLCALAPTST